eukprot:TRINITY_DN1595_c2_g1_i1.p1 TRINITY_DN1595_c2_g1~~TRINITY_DN1595_c2_g1_i1.p1  ORF type:complete len:1119 (+),score=258.88 TRINITY_DN1595_c2_g1_i1:111-3467(+)
MPCLVHLRPTIAAFAVLITAASLGGGLLLYNAGLRAVSNVVDDSARALENTVAEGIAALNLTTREARLALQQTVDSGSKADILLFGELLRRTFTSVQESAQLAGETLYTVLHETLDRGVLERTARRQACGQVLASARENNARVSGVGLVMASGNESGRYAPNASVFASYCWWDPMPDGSYAWSSFHDTHYQNGSNGTEGTWMVDYYTINEGSGELVEFVDTIPVSTSWKLDLMNTPNTSSWNNPSTWWVEEGLIALYMQFEHSLVLDRLPEDHPLLGSAVIVAAECDLAHWPALVEQFIRERSPDGSFFVIDPKHLVCVMHTHEPTVDTSSTEACQNGLSSGLAGLGDADSSACFPVVYNYSDVTQFVVRTLQEVDSENLTTATYCVCDGEPANCSEISDCNGTTQSDDFYMRKHFLWQAGDYPLHVVWYRNATEVRGDVERKEAEALRKVSDLRDTSALRVAETEERSEHDIDNALIVMLLFLVLSFALNVIISLIWIVFLAGPMTRLEVSVGLLGNLKIPEAVAEIKSMRSSIEVREIRSIGQHFERAAEHLEMYRSFLPNSCLDDGSPTHSSGLGTVPPGIGSPSADVCIVFTDVQQSTELWECIHQGMYEALLVHNRTLRHVAKLHNGYEVKTIGDAFMFAFDDVGSAVKFALEGQSRLAEEEWPSDLLCHDLCAPVRIHQKNVWRGLRVRIGVHMGTVRVETNPTTGRCDYFGTPVNTAARVESAIRFGGLTGVTEHVLGLMGNDLAGYGCSEPTPLGLRHLKGVTTPISIWILVPKELDARVLILAQRQDDVESSRLGSRNPLASEHSDTASEASMRLQGTNSAVALRPRLNLELRRSTVTCATVRGSLAGVAEGAQPRPVAIVAHAAEMSSGLVDAVLSSACIVTWNANRSCGAPDRECLRFLSAVHDPSRVRDCPISGVSSGTAQCGNAIVGRRRLPTLFGAVVELSLALAEEGVATTRRVIPTPLGPTPVLAQGSIAALAASQGAAFRAQVWTSDGHEPTVVWHIRPQKSASTDERWGNLMGVPADRAEAASEIDMALVAAAEKSGNNGVVDLCAADDGEDLAFLAHRHECGLPLVKCVAPLWGAGVELRRSPRGESFHSQRAQMLTEM